MTAVRVANNREDALVRQTREGRSDDDHSVIEESPIPRDFATDLSRIRGSDKSNDRGSRRPTECYGRKDWSNADRRYCSARKANRECAGHQRQPGPKREANHQIAAVPANTFRGRRQESSRREY